MAVFEGHSGIAFEKGCFDHHEVGVPDVLGQPVARFCVAHDDELLASFGRSQHVLGIDRPAVRQNDRLSFRQIFAHRTVRHAEWTAWTSRACTTFPRTSPISRTAGRSSTRSHARAPFRRYRRCATRALYGPGA